MPYILPSESSIPCSNVPVNHPDVADFSVLTSGSFYDARCLCPLGTSINGNRLMFTVQAVTDESPPPCGTKRYEIQDATARQSGLAELVSQ